MTYCTDALAMAQINAPLFTRRVIQWLPGAWPLPLLLLTWLPPGLRANVRTALPRSFQNYFIGEGASTWACGCCWSAAQSPVWRMTLAIAPGPTKRDIARGITIFL
nr:hypothetical protein [Nodosilinea sp. P-1105]